MVTQLMLIKDADKGLNPSKSLPQMQLRDSENSPPSQTIAFSIKVFKGHVNDIKQPQTLPKLGGNTLRSDVFWQPYLENPLKNRDSPRLETFIHAPSLQR